LQKLTHVPLAIAILLVSLMPRLHQRNMLLVARNMLQQLVAGNKQLVARNKLLVARAQHVASSNMLRATSNLLRATCCLLPRNMLRWCKCGFTLKFLLPFSSCTCTSCSLFSTSLSCDMTFARLSRRQNPHIYVSIGIKMRMQVLCI